VRNINHQTKNSFEIKQINQKFTLFRDNCLQFIFLIFRLLSHVLLLKLLNLLVNRLASVKRLDHVVELSHWKSSSLVFPFEVLCEELLGVEVAFLLVGPWIPELDVLANDDLDVAILLDCSFHVLANLKMS